MASAAYCWAASAACPRQAEISDFSGVLYCYLAIEEIPDLLARLRRLAEERRAQREEMSKSLDSFLQELRGKLSVLQAQKEEIIKNPPWGKGNIPTRAETDRRIDDLLHEVAGLAETEAPAGLSRQDKICKIKEWNAALMSGKQETLAIQLRDLEAKRAKAQELKKDLDAVTSSIMEAEADIEKLAEKERLLLGDQSLEELERELESANREHTEAELRATIRRYAHQYIQQYAPSACPVCNQTMITDPCELEEEDCGANAATSRRDELRKRISDIKQVRDELNKHRSSLASSQEKAAKIAADVKTIMGGGSVPADLERYIQTLDNAIQSAQNQIEDAQAEHDRRDRRISDLEREERFHHYQDEIAAIETILEDDVERPRNVLAEYDSFVATAEEVAKLILNAFDVQVEKAVCPLEEKLTQVFVRLTAHPSYDGVSIYKQSSNHDRLEPGQLELRVTSSRCPGKFFPPNVLNGQAARALQLVPYFVFSDYWHKVMELNLLLIDDPSESFDTSHLDHLMSVLQSVASHTQIVVASHETEKMLKMLPLIKKYFPAEQHCIVYVKDFDPLRGPTLE